MKLISFNVNGLRAVHNKGELLPLLESERPHALLLQETKANLEHLPGELTDVPGYHLRVHAAKKRGYSGVAIYAAEEPDEWIEGIGDDAFDDEGRVLGARFGDVVALSAYFPNSQAKGARLEYRLAFGARLREFLQDLLERGYHVALGGDYNVAHESIDLARPKQNTQNPGFLPEERAWMGEFLASGFVDTRRRRNEGVEGGYSWWSYRTNARARNLGWRLDYFCVDEGLDARVREVGILDHVQGSDHCPVAVVLG